MQGASAVADIVQAFRYWTEGSHRVSALPNVIVLTRGGGSLEDLQAFNSEEVARAIFACPIPVVVGVGHERDVTIADLVADVRASTPSNAAERVVPDRRDIADALRATGDRMAARMASDVASRWSMLERFTLRGASFVQRRRARVEAAVVAMTTRVVTASAVMRDRVAAAERMIGNLHPNRLLARGYSMTLAGGKIVRSVRRIRPGDVLTSRFSDGEVTSVAQA